jgi:hypothetical protein
MKSKRKKTPEIVVKNVRLVQKPTIETATTNVSASISSVKTENTLTRSEYIRMLEKIVKPATEDDK